MHLLCSCTQIAATRWKLTEPGHVPHPFSNHGMPSQNTEAPEIPMCFVMEYFDMERNSGVACPAVRWQSDGSGLLVSPAFATLHMNNRETPMPQCDQRPGRRHGLIPYPHRFLPAAHSTPVPALCFPVTEISGVTFHALIPEFYDGVQCLIRHKPPHGPCPALNPSIANPTTPQPDRSWSGFQPYYFRQFL